MEVTATVQAPTCSCSSVRITANEPVHSLHSLIWRRLCWCSWVSRFRWKRRCSWGGRISWKSLKKDSELRIQSDVLNCSFFYIPGGAGSATSRLVAPRVPALAVPLRRAIPRATNFIFSCLLIVVMVLVGSLLRDCDESKKVPRFWVRKKVLVSAEIV